MGARVAVIVIAVIFLVGGGLVAIGGGVLMGFFGSDDTVTSGTRRLSTSTNALVAALNDIQDTHGFATESGSPTLRVSVLGADRNVFIGMGPAAAVDGYLAGVAYDKVTEFDLNPYRLESKRVDGTNDPAPPDKQTFWTVRATGTHPALTWKVTDGSYRLVLMNADGAAPVVADVSASLLIPHLFKTGVNVLVGGLVGAVIGIILFVVAARMPTRPPAQRAPA
jgi:hypothetical protein